MLSVRQRYSTVASYKATRTSDITIMVNGCTGKMGRTVIEVANSRGISVLPFAFVSEKNAGRFLEVCGKEIQLLSPSQQGVLASMFRQHPDLIVVDYTVPSAVNDNANIYCNIGVPFVMGTTGGDRERLYETVENSRTYAVISPQMGKPVVAFLAAMQFMAEQFPDLFSGYKLEVIESHQEGKLDTSGTAKDVVTCFQKMGVSYDFDDIKMIRDPKSQRELVGVPNDFLSSHAFHDYCLASRDAKVFFEFQHNVCGRSIYGEGTIDAVLFLHNKVHEKAEQRIYNMIDVMRHKRNLD